MPGPPVTIGAIVTLTPGAAGVPDTGTLTIIPPPFLLANGMPLATVGSTCIMINSITGIPYPVVIPPLGASTGVTMAGKALVRLGDRIVIGPAILLIAGVPPMPTLVDSFPP
ncbi:MAG: hypothetical protein MI919_33295 [Holophagales bacterium]|nr:hypothetical protein [Holophagales bacterium]